MFQKVITGFDFFFLQLEFNASDETKASHASSLYATACRHFHQAATILTALTGQTNNDENVINLSNQLFDSFRPTFVAKYFFLVL